MSEEEKKETKVYKRPLLHKIVNVFIGLISIFLFLLIVFFGFSQTKTFRNYLKNQITSTISNSINGDLYIESLEGSVLSSLILKNSFLVSENDTLFSAEELVVKTSPVHLFLKRIYIRDVIINNSFIKLQESSDGKWNFSKLTESEAQIDQIKEISDSTSEPFPFSIQVNNLAFQNLNFAMQTFQNKNSKNNYKYLTPDDLQLSEIYLDAKLFANMSTSTVRLSLNNLSGQTNFESFNLRKLSGEFELRKNFSRVNNLILETDSSTLNINAKVDELNLLGDVELRDFKEYPMELSFQAYPIKFSDLYTFIEDIDFLNEEAYINMQAQGYFGDFDVKNLEMSFLNSYLNLNGKVKNLHTPEKLFLDVNINDSKIVESEAYQIVKGLEIPLYENVTITNLNAMFKGEPTRFHAKLNGNINKGQLDIDTYLDLQQDEMDYDISVATNKIDLYPLLDITTSLTSKLNIKGVGTDPNLMSANLNLTAINSTIDSIEIDSVNLTTIIQSKLLDLNLSSIVNNAKLAVSGKLDLRNDEEPIYDLLGDVTNLQLYKFTGDVSDSSDLNLEFRANGKNLEIDELIGSYEFTLQPSYLRDLSLDETSIKLSLLKDDNERSINLTSEFADFNIEGAFSLDKAIDIILYEADAITSIIEKKIDELNPIDSELPDMVIEQSEIPAIAKENLEFNFNFLFKDFELIAEFLKNDELDITGSGEGTVINDSLHFEISTDISIENLLNKKKNDILYLSNIDANMNFSRDNRTVSFNNIFGTISVEGEKIYAGIEINDIVSDFVFNQSKLFINSSFMIEDYLSAEFEGLAVTSYNEERIDLSNIVFTYNNLPWKSYDTSFVVFNDDGIQFSNLRFENGATFISIDGQLNNDESHNMFINVEGMPGEVLSSYVLPDKSDPFQGEINLDFTSNGFIKNPKIDLDLNMNSISYNGFNFGSLSCKVNHLDSNSVWDIDFINSTSNSGIPLLTLDANTPLNINYLDFSKTIDNDKYYKVSLRANEFEIGTFGNVLPLFKNQKGKLDAKVDIDGPLKNLNSNGYLNLTNGTFTYRDNNLDYGTELNTTFNNQIASIDKFRLFNVGGSNYKGNINGSGRIGLKHFPISNFDINLKGDLALLGKKSKTRKSNIYGDLLVKAEDEWKINFDGSKYSFDGDIIIDRANLIYAPKNDFKDKYGSNIEYKYIVDTSLIDLNKQKFVKILNETRLSNNNNQSESSSKFNMNTNIIITNIASFNFLISPELNQKLTVETTGRLELETIGDDIKAQGSLELLNGSRLEFFKSFDAKGRIRFESDLTDPHFDVVATYIGEIENFEGTSQTEDVAVKLKLNTAYSELRENLSGNKENLTVYVGRTKIENDIPDQRYDQSNALTFVIFDQLSLDLNNEQRSTLANMTGNAAFSLLSSQLTSYLSNSLGGLINNIQLNKYSSRDSYKLLFSGKYNNIRYSFGGSFGAQTDYLQLSKADIKFEYLLNPNFLIRIEQKDPIIETTSEEKVREFGLKYKFEF